MLLDKASVIKGVKLGMASADKAKTQEIELALTLCLDDYTTKYKSKSMLKSYSATITANDRTVTLEGDNSDLKYIFALKYASGTANEVVLEYIDPSLWLEEYDSSQESANIPSKFTQLGSEFGKPTVKFNCPALSSTTMLVYYYPEVTGDDISNARTGAAIVVGTKAYFYGLESVEGARLYEAYKDLIGGARAADEYIADIKSQFKMNQDDRKIYSAAWRLKDRRAR